MKISVIMIDGGFRENTYGAKYFSEQDFPSNDYEVIWVEYFSQPNAEVLKNSKIRVITLNREDIYHSSFCFNRGIYEAKGELLVIPDADQIVYPDFLSRIWALHSQYDKLAVYCYRYDEISRNSLKSFDFEELEKKCILKNPLNYGGCLTVRKKWMLELNGYEQHPIFGTGYHANGLDIYTRFKNLGLAIRWEPTLKIFHPWHAFTLMPNKIYDSQKKLIEWRKKNIQWTALEGLDSSKNFTPSTTLQNILEKELNYLNKGISSDIARLFCNQASSFKKMVNELIAILKFYYSPT